MSGLFQNHVVVISNRVALMLKPDSAEIDSLINQGLIPRNYDLAEYCSEREQETRGQDTGSDTPKDGT